MKLNKDLTGLVILLSFVVLSFSCSTVAPDVMEMMEPEEEEMETMDSTSSMLDPAPDFTLESVNGPTVSLSGFAGKPLVIFFFGNTCPRCIGSAPDIQSSIVAKFPSSDVAVIGIDVWDGNKASVENFRSTTGVTFDLLLEGSGVATDYSTTYDRLFVINAKGEIAFKGTSAAGGQVDDVVEILEKLTE